MDVDGTRSLSPPASDGVESENSLPKLKEDFIILLETLPELWNPQHKYYTSKHKRRAGYERLLDVLKKIKPQATVEDVRKKINSLKSNYRRELRKITKSKRSGAGVDDVYTPKTKTFKLLSYLYTTEKPNYSQQQTPTPKNRKRKIDIKEENSEDSEPEQYMTLDDRDYLAVSSDPLERLTTTTSPTAPSKRVDPGVMACNLTEYDLVGMNVAKKLAKMSPIQAMYAEFVINNVLRRGLVNKLSDVSDVCDAGCRAT